MSDSSKHTGRDAASAASEVLKDGRTSDDSKSAAASALSQAEKGSNKGTGDAAATAASNVLQSEDTGDRSKKAAGRALSQAEDSDS